jgi:hypothetical protein
MNSLAQDIRYGLFLVLLDSLLLGQYLLYFLKEVYFIIYFQTVKRPQRRFVLLVKYASVLVAPFFLHKIILGFEVFILIFIQSPVVTVR